MQVKITPPESLSVDAAHDCILGWIRIFNEFIAANELDREDQIWVKFHNIQEMIERRELLQLIGNFTEILAASDGIIDMSVDVGSSKDMALVRLFSREQEDSELDVTLCAGIRTTGEGHTTSFAHIDHYDLAGDGLLLVVYESQEEE